MTDYQVTVVFFTPEKQVKNRKAKAKKLNKAHMFWDAVMDTMECVKRWNFDD